MRKINLPLVGMPAALAFVFTLGAGPVRGQDKITKTLTFDTPACPIQATTVPPTHKEFLLPLWNPLLTAFSVAGTVQIADQSGGVIFKTSSVVTGDLTHVTFARTVNTIQHLTGQLTFDHGCSSTDPYGSNNCSWYWGNWVSANYQSALQEDITSGKFVVDMKINNNIPFSFSCPVCGAKCTIPIPEQLQASIWDDILMLTIRFIRFQLGLGVPSFMP